MFAAELRWADLHILLGAYPMKIRELGEHGKAVKEQVAQALKTWPPRENKPLHIVDVRQDMETDTPGTLQIVVKTWKRTFWKVRINHGTFVDAALC